MRALIEEGLRRIVRERADRGGFEMRKVSFRGEGVSPDLEDGSWDRIRRRIYEHHGE